MSIQEERESRTIHSPDFPIPVKQPELVELPIQLRDGSWIMLSDVRSIKCHDGGIGGLGAIEINMIGNKVIWIAMENKEAREYADILGNQWRQSIIDRAKFEAGLTIGDPPGT